MRASLRAPATASKAVPTSTMLLGSGVPPPGPLPVLLLELPELLELLLPVTRPAVLKGVLNAPSMSYGVPSSATACLPLIAAKKVPATRLGLDAK